MLNSYWNRLYHGTSFVLHRKSPLCPTPSATSLESCIRAAGAYIDDVHDLLKNSNVPISWMLAQGVLFAGLTMLITSRTNFTKIPRQTSLALLLVDFPAWTRRCAVCLAIINERWSHALLAKLTGQFEALADSTHRVVSTTLLSAPVDFPDNQTEHAGHVAAQASSIPGVNDMSFGCPPSTFPEQSPDLMENYDSFTELFGASGTSSFWEFSNQDMDMALDAGTGFPNGDIVFNIASAEQGNIW